MPGDRDDEGHGTFCAGIVGARGRFNFGESDWFANAYVDVGGGSSVFTWQGAVLAAERIGGAFRSAGRLGNRIAAGVFALAGLGLALTRRP